MPKYDGTLYIGFSFEGAYGEDEDDLERRALAALKSGSLDDRLHEGGYLQLDDLESSGPRGCDVTIEADVHLRYSTSTELDDVEAERLEIESGCLTSALDLLSLDVTDYDEADTVDSSVEIEWEEDDEPDEHDPFWVKPPEPIQYHEAESDGNGEKPVAYRMVPLEAFQDAPSE